MKKTYILIAISFVLASPSLFAQEVIRLQSCNDTFIQKQVDSVKKIFGTNGYTVLKEASITMESEYEMPVIVPLKERALYEIVFIGDITSKLYEVRMYD